MNLLVKPSTFNVHIFNNTLCALKNRETPVKGQQSRMWGHRASLNRKPCEKWTQCYDGMFLIF